mmetsp:Transcript_73862/g.204658  ORF Transcript_73862/g.204658 Transcript_73862/m.204658 type:complete len:168 (+) Transcript_73862:421-924(+)
MPILGTLLRSMGHPLVPFKSESQDGGSEVDKEIMAQRQQELEDHVRNGGTAAWFPEGRLNPSDPLDVLQFRAGGFTLAAKLDVEVWCIAFVGNQDCWARKAALGGLPARISVCIFNLCESSHGFIASSGPGLEHEREASIFLANQAHDAIQRAVKRSASELYSAGKE